jgi:hypothetical protein
MSNSLLSSLLARVIRRAAPLCLAMQVLLSVSVFSAAATAAEPDWSVGAYVGRYHDTEPGSMLVGRGNFDDHYMLALTGSKTVWRAQDWPLSLEIDAMVGWQSGKASLGEIAVAPALRWSLPWRDTLRVDLRAAPLGVSYTTEVGPMERGPTGKGSQWLNWLFLEAAVSTPANPADEYFVRLHHRCAVYDLINNYGANGEDFLTVGFRKRF